MKQRIATVRLADKPSSDVMLERKGTMWDSLGFSSAAGLTRLLAVWSLLIGLSILPAPVTADNGESVDELLLEKATTMYEKYSKSFPQVEDIDAEDAITLLDNEGVVFVDVRRRKEQAVSMIPGAITADQLTDDIESYRGKRIIAYCTISYRSGKLAARLMKDGLPVENLKAGLLGWTHAGGPLADDNGPTNRLHVYGRKWDLAPAGIETVH